MSCSLGFFGVTKAEVSSVLLERSIFKKAFGSIGWRDRVLSRASDEQIFKKEAAECGALKGLKVVVEKIERVFIIL